MELLHQWGINMGDCVQSFGSKPSAPKGKEKYDCEQLLNELIPFVEYHNQLIQELCNLEITSGRNTKEYEEKLRKLRDFNKKFDNRISGLNLMSSDGLSRYALEFIKKKKQPEIFQYFSQYFAAHSGQFSPLKARVAPEEVVARFVVEGLNDQIDAVEKDENCKELAAKLITARYEILKDFPETERWFCQYGFFGKGGLLGSFGKHPIRDVSDYVNSLDEKHFTEIVDHSKYHTREMIEEFIGSCEKAPEDNQFNTIMRVLYYRALSKIAYREEQVDAMDRALGIRSSDELDKLLPTSNLFTLSKSTDVAIS